MDTEQFERWYISRRLRVAGRPPSPQTVRTKRSRINQVARTLNATGLENLATLLASRQALDGLLDSIAARVTPGSARVIVDALGDFAKYCEAMGWPVPPLTANDRPAPNPQKPIVIYTEEEIATLLCHAEVVHGYRWKLLLETLVGTGRRISEVLDLEWGWLNLSAETPHFHLPNTKNGAQAYVPLSMHLVQLWGDSKCGDLKLGIGRYKRNAALYPFPWTYPVAQRNFGRYCARVGVESRGFHCFRHTRATNLLARGVPIQAVSAILGHSSVATTDKLYNHTSALSYGHYVE